LREAAIAIDPDDLDLAADMPLPGPAKVAMAAADMTFTRHLFAPREGLDSFPDRFDHTHEFVPYDEGWMDAALGPFIPRVDMEIGAADTGFFDADQDVVSSARRPLNRFEPNAWSAVPLQEGGHFGCHV
jgi:hypothetical protein